MKEEEKNLAGSLRLEDPALRESQEDLVGLEDLAGLEGHLDWGTATRSGKDWGTATRTASGRRDWGTATPLGRDWGMATPWGTDLGTIHWA